MHVNNGSKVGISIGIYMDPTLDMEHLSVFISQFFCETEDGIGQSDPAWDPWDTCDIQDGGIPNCWYHLYSNLSPINHTCFVSMSFIGLERSFEVGHVPRANWMHDCGEGFVFLFLKNTEVDGQSFWEDLGLKIHLL